ncbi:MAG: hypothetical protein HOV80_16315 [Polyangiaceae bacterium]|nr:hypothetical protein [Polyangiaceae bacterium]
MARACSGWMLLGLVALSSGCAAGTAAPPRSSSDEHPNPELREIDVAVGRAHSCVLRSGGSVFCWGANEIGQLGDGTQRTRTAPVRVLDLDDAINVRAAGDTTCAVRRSGLISCWGGAVGKTPRADRGTGFSVRATTIKDLHRIVDVAVAPTHACAWTADGQVACFGSNERGALGDPSVGKQGDLGLVELGGPAASVWVGPHSSCAIAVDGRLACWGQADALRFPGGTKLGDCRTDHGDRLCVYKPVGLPIGFAAAAVWVDDRALCVLGQKGELGCRGESARGACTNRFCDLSPGTHQLLMFGMSGLSRRVGERAVMDTQGAVYGWGAPGDLACIAGAVCKMRRRLIDEPIAGAQVVSIGDGHGCAAGPRGVRCWGNNERGQLGAGDRAPHAETVIVKLDDPPQNDLASPNALLAAVVDTGKLSRLALVWENAELFEAPDQKASLGKLAVWEDALRLDPFEGRFAARILREVDGFVLIELQASASDQCSGSAAYKIPLRAYVKRDALVPVVPRPTEVSFEDGSSILLGAGLAPTPDGQGFAFDVFGDRAWVGADKLTLGVSYTKAGHAEPEPKLKLPRPDAHGLRPGGHQTGGVLPETVNARLGGRRLRTKPNARAAFSEPDATGGSFVTLDSPCARVRLSTDVARPLRQVSSGTMGYGAGAYLLPNRSFTARAGSVARWPSGKVAAQLAEPLTFYEATASEHGWCTPVRGSVSICFDERDVTVRSRKL